MTSVKQLLLEIGSFLPRDAMLARYRPMPSSCECLSDCHKPVFYWNS